ncbi:MAG: dihydroorotase, partial [Chloroflexi bacterium]|nr:dihydroorotase [Chloroflexota bacterium]
SPADVTVFDPNAEWVVDPARFASKGKNTPLKGFTLKGRVVATFVAGRVVYAERGVLAPTTIQGGP